MIFKMAFKSILFPLQSGFFTFGMQYPPRNSIPLLFQKGLEIDISIKSSRLHLAGAKPFSLMADTREQEMKRIEKKQLYRHCRRGTDCPWGP
jgi:hypothetical protein